MALDLNYSIVGPSLNIGSTVSTVEHPLLFVRILSRVLRQLVLLSDVVRRWGVGQDPRVDDGGRGTVSVQHTLADTRRSTALGRNVNNVVRTFLSRLLETHWAVSVRV